MNMGSAALAWRGEDPPWSTSRGLSLKTTGECVEDAWRVAEGVETLSDHLYLLMEVAPLETTSTASQASRTRGVNRPRPPPRWRLKERVQADAPGGSSRCFRLELGRAKNVGERRRGSGKSPKRHERGV